MLLECGTLDDLSIDRFRHEVRVALSCIAEATPEQSEQLALSDVKQMSASSPSISRATSEALVASPQSKRCPPSGFASNSCPQCSQAPDPRSCPRAVVVALLRIGGRREADVSFLAVHQPRNIGGACCVSAEQAVPTFRFRFELMPAVLASAFDRHRLIARSSGVVLRHFGHVTLHAQQPQIARLRHRMLGSRRRVVRVRQTLGLVREQRAELELAEAGQREIEARELQVA